MTTPTDLNLLPFPFPAVDQIEGLEPYDDHLFASPKPQPDASYTSSPSISLSCPFIFIPTHDHVPQPFPQGPKVDNEIVHQRDSCPGVSGTTIIKDSDSVMKFCIKQHHVDGNQGGCDGDGSGKWISSKMGLTQELMKNSNQMGSAVKPIVHTAQGYGDRAASSTLETDNSCSNNSSVAIRVCSDCNTTKTPLWRSGPRGPKSLCNACGIRQRKARRAMAAAAAAEAAGNVPDLPSGNKISKKNKKTKNGCSAMQYKKRCKMGATQRRGRKKKVQLEDYVLGLSEKNSAFHHRVFPQDEKEAAILLMALSCGLVHG